MIAVVGGRGFIGGAIVKALRGAGHEVVVVTHTRDAAGARGHRFGDMLRPETLGPALSGAEVVVQAAMFPTYPIEKPGRGQTFEEFDGRGTERLVTAARAAGVRRYIYISGSGIPAESPRPYFQAILRGEKAVTGSGMEAVCVRPAFVYGPLDHGLNRILSAAKKLPFLPVVGTGRQLEQPVFVEDLAEVVRQAVGSGAPTGVFEVGGPERFTLDEMLSRFFRVVGLSRPVVHVPYGLARFGAALLELLPGPPLTVNAVDFLTEDFVADTRALLSSFDVRLTPFEEGLRKYLPR
ncbi:MAG TPA: NAD-dependent epimerase/dehydratase family protein [Pyrinomonadaceae bacterium]|nr:NAD-dependent epimerase/dehydratase family protein [Pyrinomonadaceae bacterium]